MPAPCPKPMPYDIVHHMKDKYSAVWISYSSISDYLKCPRAYYLKNIYRDPKTNNKLSLMQPALALGQAVHDVLESLSLKPQDERFVIPLVDQLEEKWKRVHGEMGGFTSEAQEEEYKQRAKDMLARVDSHRGPLTKKAIKIRQELPFYWFSEEDNIILCGKIDWLEYIESSDSVRIIDFKTGKYDEDPDSLQLPMYLLLAANCQNRPVTGAQYWYLGHDNEPVDVSLPSLDEAKTRVEEVAKRVVLARKLERFVCKNKDGCPVCRPYELIVSGQAKYVGLGTTRKQDVYIIPKKVPTEE